MAERTRARRLKYAVIGLLVVGAGGALLAATQQWFTLRVGSPETGATDLAVSGQVASPALAALGFAGLALAAALAIAGPVIRIVLGVLGLVVGASMVLAAGIALGDPVLAGASAVTAATGLAGHESVHAAVTDVTTTAWPAIAIVAGCLVAIASLAALVTTRVWPASSRRYQAVRLQSADPADRAVDDWDELTGGEDPTR